jgi:hypothetical protein
LVRNSLYLIYFRFLNLDVHFSTFRKFSVVIYLIPLFTPSGTLRMHMYFGDVVLCLLGFSSFFLILFLFCLFE